MLKFSLSNEIAPDESVILPFAIVKVPIVEPVAVDIVDEKEGWSLGRSYRDAPEIDNYVKIDQALKSGRIYDVRIKEAFEYDVLGVVEK